MKPSQWRHELDRGHCQPASRMLRGRTLLFCLALLGGVLPTSTQALEAGVAKLEITPQPGVPLHGYGMRQGQVATAVHDPLWARSLYLDDGETQVFLVSVDMIGITRALRDRVLELAPGQIASDNIILTATHTHNGPGGLHRALPFRQVGGRYMPEVVDELAYRIAESMRMAYEARTRAAIGYGSTRNPDLSANRMDPEGPVDPSIGVLRVDDADGNPMAIAAIHAAHPTLVPSSHRFAFSADYPGVFYEELEAMSSEGCVAFFFNGALGNQSAGNPESEEGWARLESVGELLALQVKGASNDILCGEAALYVGATQARLPQTLAPGLFPEDVLLQTLEIDDLLLTFFPGEPTVEVGLAMRAQALARGYEQQHVVGLANDSLLYFVTWEQYTGATYENAMNYYGPHIAEWFYDQFSFLMRKPPVGGESVPLPGVPSELVENGDYLPDNRTIPGGTYVRLAGEPGLRGQQKGRLLGELLHEKYTAYVAEPIATGQLTPQRGFWGALPGFIDPTPLALPALAMSVRPHLEAISTDLRRELEGVALSADMHFDKLWILQHIGRLPHVDDKEALFALPFCTMVAVLGERAEGAPLLVARNLDWALEEAHYVVEVAPENGRRFLQVGFGWNSGVQTGMNDAGLVVALERLPMEKYAVENRIALELILRDILATHTSVMEAVAVLQALPPMPGYQILVAGFDAGEATAVVLSYGEAAQLRGPENAVLLGVDPGLPVLDTATRVRYERAASLIQSRPAFSVADLQALLHDANHAQPAAQRIWNAETRHSVVFDPQRRALHVAFPDENGERGPFTTFSLQGE